MAEPASKKAKTSSALELLSQDERDGIVEIAKQLPEAATKLIKGKLGASQTQTAVAEAVRALGQYYRQNNPSIREEEIQKYAGCVVELLRKELKGGLMSVQGHQNVLGNFLFKFQIPQSYTFEQALYDEDFLAKKREGDSEYQVQIGGEQKTTEPIMEALDPRGHSFVVIPDIYCPGKKKNN